MRTFNPYTDVCFCLIVYDVLLSLILTLPSFALYCHLSSNHLDIAFVKQSR